MPHSLETLLNLFAELNVRQGHVDGLERTGLPLVILIVVDLDRRLQIRLETWSCT